METRQGVKNASGYQPRTSHFSIHLWLQTAITGAIIVFDKNPTSIENSPYTKNLSLFTDLCYDCAEPEMTALRKRNLHQ